MVLDQQIWSIDDTYSFKIHESFEGAIYHDQQLTINPWSFFKLDKFTRLINLFNWSLLSLSVILPFFKESNISIFQVSFDLQHDFTLYFRRPLDDLFLINFMVSLFLFIFKFNNLEIFILFRSIARVSWTMPPRLYGELPESSKV